MLPLDYPCRIFVFIIQILVQVRVLENSRKSSVKSKRLGCRKFFLLIGLFRPYLRCQPGIRAVVSHTQRGILFSPLVRSIGTSEVFSVCVMFLFRS